MGSNHLKLKLSTSNLISLIAAMLWSIVLAGLFFWAASKEESHVFQYAKMEAGANFNKDIALRNWLAKHGGIYVEVSGETPPNPYLQHIAERDIVTSSGKKLTLMNPAYILRQTMNEYSVLYGIKGRITSLEPLNPINTPDSWEIEALKQFSQGVEDVSEVTSIGGKPFLRYMQAFYTKKKCLKCHGHQGYRVGNVQGGVGVAIPLEPYIKIKNDTLKILIYSHGILWLFGLFCILLINRYVKRQIDTQNRIRSDLASQKEQLDLVLEGTQLGLWDWNLVTNYVVFDERWAKILGYELSEIEFTLNSWESRVHPDDLASCYQDIQSYIDGKTSFYSNIHRMMHKDGKWRYILDRGKIVERDINNKPIRFTGTHTDITKLKETENTLQEKSSELEQVNKILSKQAMIDGLTNVNNRRAFDQRIKEEWERCHRNQTGFSVLMADIDYFKKYNDTYGHLGGDNCLKYVADALNKVASRTNDFVARYGGEEFIMILPGTGLEQAMIVAEKARNAIESLDIQHASSDCADVVTISVGVVACTQCSNINHYMSLISLADKALYLAKNNGRNCMACL
ncbi:diguanylate cyclase [Candidatus Venteria ishoeyi]|uniref:diguanylate cyclase n=1 Tax=Candidatus Venteria ishoeyi TaxID=1899563 RepID=A0A1H6FC90_9GAMM|nr:diguanylate cyclase [Candidatus Venteria ishoeyi]SEH07688.1 Phytochrome-like protein cph2 [Candidatus Venteria ishoeyi]